MGRKYSGMSVSDFISESKKGNIDANDFYGAFFSEIEKLQKKYNYFVTISQDSAMEQLKKLPKGAIGALGGGGFPISVKDNICTKGIRTTAGSKILETYVPPFDATCVERAKKEGGIIIGKTVQDEFGFGTFSVNSAYGIPKNPHDAERSCGGSSGGAGGITAAVDFPHAAIAESTGGSISAPAAFCGVFGLTPTYGRVSRYGLIDYASSLDKIGVMAKHVDDIGLVLSAIAGHDAKDSTSLTAEADDYFLKTDLKSLKIGVPHEFFGTEINEGIKKVVWAQIKKFESMGAKVEECSLPSTEFSVPAYYIIAMAEASTNLAKFCGIRYGATLPLAGEFNEYFSKVRGKYLGEEAKRRIILGTYARMAGYRDKYYLKALKVRQLIIDDYRRAFGKYDVLVSPAMPFIAPKFSEIKKLMPVEHYYADILTGSPNLAGIPMLSAPCGTSKGMPVGIHILGNYLAEKTILNVGRHI